MEPEDSDTTVAPDPLEVDSWHLKNVGQKSFSANGGTIGEDINSDNTFTRGLGGEGIKVAISDNGTEIYHPDLVANSWFGYHRNYNFDNSNFWNSDPTPDGDNDIDAHGTAVTGIIAAVNDNGKGSRGIASKAEFAGFLYVGTPYSLIKTLDQAHGSFDIFNYSYGRNSCMFQEVAPQLIEQLFYGVTHLRNGKGSIYVKASGNEYVSHLTDCFDGESGYYLGNANLEEDNSYPFMTVVSANTSDGVSASYATPGSSVWISAPGGEFGINHPAIITTDLTSCDKGFANTTNGYNSFDLGGEKNVNCDYTSTMNGTSSAAPMVSGVAAVLLGIRNDLSWRDLKYVLALSARKIDSTRGDNTNHPFSSESLSGHIYEYGWQENSAGFNFHNYYGFGAVDLDQAVSVLDSYPVLPTPVVDSSWRHDSGSVSFPIPDNSSYGVTDSINVSENITIEAIQIRVSITHTHASEIGIVLESPSGMKSTLMYINSGIIQSNLDNEILLSNTFLGEISTGRWKLKIIDAKSGNSGVLTNWKINFWGHYDDGHDLQRKPTFYSQANVNVANIETTIIQKSSSTIGNHIKKDMLEVSKIGLNSNTDPTSTKYHLLFTDSLKKIKNKYSYLFDKTDSLIKTYFSNGKFYFLFQYSETYRVFDDQGNSLKEIDNLIQPKSTVLSEQKIAYLINKKKLSYFSSEIDFTQETLFFDEASILTKEGFYNNAGELTTSFVSKLTTVHTIIKNDKYKKVFGKRDNQFVVIKLTQNGEVIDTISHNIRGHILLAKFHGDNLTVIYQSYKNERIFLKTYNKDAEEITSLELPESYIYDEFLFIGKEIFKVNYYNKRYQLMNIGKIYE